MAFLLIEKLICTIFYLFLSWKKPATIFFQYLDRYSLKYIISYFPKFNLDRLGASPNDPNFHNWTWFYTNCLSKDKVKDKIKLEITEDSTPDMILFQFSWNPKIKKIISKLSNYSWWLGAQLLTHFNEKILTTYYICMWFMQK